MIVDSNVLIDLAGPATPRTEKVARGFASFAAEHRMVINHVIFAEISARQDSEPSFSGWLRSLGISILPFSTRDAFLAGTAFRAYRAKGGPRTTILPDFMIGGQAAARGLPLLTRDAKRFTSYFPEIGIIDPTSTEDD